jgi:hypothetical protein
LRVATILAEAYSATACQTLCAVLPLFGLNNVAP